MIKVTYVACDFEDKYPIVTADSFENIRKALDEYCGADERNAAKCLGFKPYDSKYGSEYEGYFEYECEFGDVKFNIYCVDFFPKTKI
jgi:hypothetical protein